MMIDDMSKIICQFINASVVSESHQHNNSESVMYEED